MSNYIEYNDRMVFHPGYYIKEMVDESGLTQEDFAKRLGTTPKNLSILIRGEQRLSIDVSVKLSRMLGTTVKFWLNLQRSYDEVQAEILSEQEFQREREIFTCIDYVYFIENFGLPETESEKEQIQNVREFLNVSSLTILQQKNMAVNLASRVQTYAKRLNMVGANIMTQTAINQTLKAEMPVFNRKKFLRAIDNALLKTDSGTEFYPVLSETFREAGVFLAVTPSLSNSGIDGAVKIVNGRIMLMVSDQNKSSDTFWFTLFREIGHILNGEYGLIFQDDGDNDPAVEYAQEKLVSQSSYEEFLRDNKELDENAIRVFAKQINRNPGIVLGRLCRDHIFLPEKENLIANIRQTYSF